MKSTAIIILTLIIFKASISATYSIEDFLLNFEKSSSFKEIKAIEKEKIEFERKDAKYTKWKKIDINANLNYYNYSHIKERKNTSFDDSFAEIGYSIFFVSATSEREYNYKYENNDISELSTLNVGVKRDIYDLIYSKDKYRRRISNLRKERFEIALKKELFSKEEELVDLYRDLIILQLDIHILNEEVKEMSFLLDRALTRNIYNAAFEIEDRKLKLLELKEDIVNLESKKESTMRKLCLLTNVPYEKNIKLNKIRELSSDKIKSPNFELKIMDIDKRISEEDIRYLKRERMGKLIPSASYDTINEDWKVELRIQSTLFNYRADLNNKIKDLGKVEIEKNLKSNLLKARKQELEKEFLHLNNNLKISKKKLELKKSRYLAAKEMFDENLFSLKDLIKIQKEFNIGKLEYSKKLNQLSCFNYKVALLKKIECDLITIK